MCKLAPADLLARGMSRLVNMKLPNPPRPSRLPSCSSVEKRIGHQNHRRDEHFTSLHSFTTF